MSDEPLVQVSELHRRYGPVHAVRGISFDLHRGEVLGFLGINGAGKTTTMAMIAGVLAPSAGRLRIAGHDLLEEPLAAKARIGYLPETPPLYPELTVDEYLSHCARLRRLRPARARAAVRDAKQRCGLADAGARLIGNLSKGFRQRVGIAQAIVHAPDVVILDEPTAGLDPVQIREIRALVRELGERHAVLLSTHILPEVQAACDRVQIIHEGRLALSGSVRTLGRAGAGDRFRVRLRQPPSPEQLAALPMLAAATARSPDCFAVEIADGAAGVARFSELCASRGWGLLELVPEGRSLEDLFVDIACGESTPTEPRP